MASLSVKNGSAEYTLKPDVPVSVSSAKTGDDTLLVEELMLAFVSGALICVLAKNIRKQKNADR